MLKTRYGKTIDEIVVDIDFRKINTNDKRIEYVFKKYLKINVLRNLFRVREVIVKNAQKSYDMSKRYYDSANREFEFISKELTAETDFARVLDNIQNAILYAPHVRQSNEMNILFNAYILRLKVHLISNLTENFIHDYIQMKSIHDSMDSSEQFVSEVNGIEKNITENMRTRIDDILREKHMKQMEEMAKLIIDKRCDFVTNPEMGRYMIAEKDIDFDLESDLGIVLIEETPQILELEKSKMNEYCSYCFAKLQNSFYPCFTCIECRFCDKVCAQKAMDGFHRFECRIIGYIKDRIGNNWLLGYRLLTSLGITDINDLHKKFIINGEGFHLKQWINKYNNEVVLKTTEELHLQYKGLSTFVEFNPKNPNKNTVSYIFDAIEIALLIEEINVFKDLTNDENLIRLVTMLFVHYNKCNPNAFSWKESVEPFGDYMALVSTMVNHSCVPNSVWTLKEGMHTITTLMDIKAGDEISISYGKVAYQNSSYESFIVRQRHLRANYQFVCDCSRGEIGCKWDKTRVTSILKCRECNGTVYYGEININRICVDCGVEDNDNVYDNIYQNIVRNHINNFYAEIEGDIHTQESLLRAEECLKQMSEYCESSSPDLKQMRRLLNSFYQ